ncbi:MAG: transglutaminase domain-containing protein [Planctomycetota bacterium]
MRDSDGDGIDDGDWAERREYAYTVRSVVHVMRPVTIEFLCDDYQDARVLDETDTYVELEVVHYPFCTIAEAPGSKKPRGLKHWLRAGPTSNASPELGKEIRRAMAKSGAEIGDLETGEGVVAAARWLLDRAEYRDGFTTFLTGFTEEGLPFVPDDLSEVFERESDRAGRSLTASWDEELFAAGMFQTGRRGSCTSSAIYLSGCLRALGVPTRTVLCIPIIDATDESEWRFVDVNLEHNGVRETIRDAMGGGRSAWTSHTFNEVWVEGRWRRLNYDRLDQGILDARFLGLMTHVATFHDWADAQMHRTVGRRQELGPRDDVFGHVNPYSTVSLRDAFGPHCDVPNPPAGDGVLAIEALHWTDSEALPEDIVANCARQGRFGLIAEIPVRSDARLKSAFDDADLRLHLTAEDAPRLDVALEPGCSWFKNDRAFVYVPFGRADREQLRGGTSYRATARNQSETHLWRLDLTVRREGDGRR